MTNKEDVENAIETYKRIIATNKNLLQKEEQLLAEINKQLEQQPKEGEWSLFDNRAEKWIIKIKSIKGDQVYFTEYYDQKSNVCLENYRTPCESVHLDFYQRPATTSEIEYFMGLHAERLYKDGCVIDRKNLSKQAATISTDEEKLNFKYPCRFNQTIGCFEYGGVWVRDELGNWATVVKEDVKIESEPNYFEWQRVLKPKKLVKKSVNLQRKIDKLEAENKRLLDLINEFVNTIKKTV